MIVVGRRAHVQHLLPTSSLGNRMRAHMFTLKTRVACMSNSSAVTYTEAISVFLKDGCYNIKS